MMSLEAIRHESEKSAQRAREEGRLPYIAKHDGDQNVTQAPFIGDYEPEGWIPTEEYFVDNSGFGSPAEMALTLEQFLEHVKEGYGYAITESGQFQVYIQEYKEA